MKASEKNRTVSKTRAVANNRSGKGISLQRPAQQKETLVNNGSQRNYAAADTNTSGPKQLRAMTHGGTSAVVQRIKVINETNDGQRLVSLTDDEYKKYGVKFSLGSYDYTLLNMQNGSYMYQGIKSRIDPWGAPLIGERENITNEDPKFLNSKEDVSDLFSQTDTKSHKESENVGMNNSEQEKDKVSPLLGDVDLIEIYRKHIRTWSSYQKIERITRSRPLSLIWVPEANFGKSPSRACYRVENNQIEISESLKGNEQEVINCIKFELMNSYSQKDFKEINLNYDQEMEQIENNEKMKQISGSQQNSYFSSLLSIFMETKKTDPEKLALAKLVVKYERTEYKNVISKEQMFRSQGEKSMYHDLLEGGKYAPWASFAKYLKSMCEAGHYINLDPDVKNENWIGWSLLTSDDYICKDQLNRSFNYDLV